MERSKEINEEKLDRYFDLTSRALQKVKDNIFLDKEKEAKEIIEMVSNYFSDAKHFYEKGDYINAFAALNYSHGWLDAGVRLKIFNISDSNLFTVR